MKARVNKKGEWTISQVSNAQLIALNKILKFANDIEIMGGNHTEREKEMIHVLREDWPTMHDAHTWRFLVETLCREDIKKSFVDFDL